jgi:hypothetical protein
MVQKYPRQFNQNGGVEIKIKSRIPSEIRLPGLRSGARVLPDQ